VFLTHSLAEWFRKKPQHRLLCVVPKDAFHTAVRAFRRHEKTLQEAAVPKPAQAHDAPATRAKALLGRGGPLLSLPIPYPGGNRPKGQRRRGFFS
jgi:hypothetical protein